jgi:hypothetical protein
MAVMDPLRGGAVLGIVEMSIHVRASVGAGSWQPSVVTKQIYDSYRINREESR